MMTVEFITALFSEVDEQLRTIPKHPEAHLWPSEVVTLGLLHARKVGGKLCLLLNQWGLIVGWACATANVADNTFQWLIRQCEAQMIVLSDTGFMLPRAIPPISHCASAARGRTVCSSRRCSRC